MAGTFLKRTNTSATNTFTFSAWVKLCNPTKTANQWIFTSNSSGLMTRDSNTGADGGEEFHFYNSSNNTNYYSGAKRRDASGWYHIVLSSNSGTGTLYVNGETDKTGIVVPNLSTSSNDMQIGRRASTGGDYFDGLMSHVHFTDGTAYDASYFGETDATTGEWKIKTSPSVTYGTNGFFILKDGNSVTDQSGNSNNFTVDGDILTKTEDCPSNVFATMNPLDNYYAGSTFSKGNNTVVTGSSSTTYNTSTIAIEPTMKCYWEAKFDTTQSGNGEIGIVDKPTTSSSAGGGASRLYYQTYGISVNDLGQVWGANANTGITLGTLSTSDIICFAWDGVNSALYVRKNGDAWINSGDPTSGASKTGAVKTHSGTRIMFPAVGDQNGSGTMQSSLNFGNGYFGTTAVSSAGSNASNNGIFEYDVPSGFTALSTKGLNL